jgi:hypothetical protein
MGDAARNIEPRYSFEEAAKLLSPDGRITAASLRREAAKGRLAFDRIAGKDVVTLSDIQRMLEQCRVQRSRPGSGSTGEKAEPHNGSSLMERSSIAQAAAEMTMQELKKRSAPMSRTSSKRRERGRRPTSSSTK